MFSIVKTDERKRARALRRDEGASIKEIAERVGVSKSSVSHWVRDIDLTPEQHAALLLRNPAYNRQRSGVAIHAARRRAEREGFQREGRRRAGAGDLSFVAGCMLYWAEGAKARNQLQFANSDPVMARFFVDFLKKHFDLPPEQIRITCHLYSDHLEKQSEVEQFWLDTLRLPRESLSEVRRERVLEVQQAEAGRESSLRNMPGRRFEDMGDADNLRSDPGDRRFRAGRLAGIDVLCPKALSSVTTAS